MLDVEVTIDVATEVPSHSFQQEQVETSVVFSSEASRAPTTSMSRLRSTSIMARRDRSPPRSGGQTRSQSLYDFALLL